MKRLNEADIIKLLREKFGSGHVHRLAGLRIRGVPDVLISFNNTAFFLEIKIDQEKLSKLQELFIQIFRKSAGVLHLYNESKQRYRTWEYFGPARFKIIIGEIKGLGIIKIEHPLKKP